MDRAMIHCQEEEFAPCFAYAWRRAAGWRSVLFYGRGPGGIGPIFGLFLTALGIWRFARRPATLYGLQSCYIGQTVRAVATCLGSYGMGGPGFLGLRFPNGWIVYRLWNAAGWLTLNGKPIGESLLPDERGLLGADNVASASRLQGAILRSVTCGDDQYDLIFTRHGETPFCLSLRRDGSTVPPWRGNGRPKVFAPDESLRDAIVVSRTGRLWSLE